MCNLINTHTHTHTAVQASDTYCRYRTCPTSCLESGCGEREARINWSMVKPEKTAPVTGTTFRTTGPVPADFRQ